MVRWALESFTNRTMAAGEISYADVQGLRRDVFPNGIQSRDEADVLIALDRAVPQKDGSWAVFVGEAVVDFVVWATRPTGRVDRDTAEWLVASLGCGSGPTETATAIAFEVVCECESSDEVLVAAVLRWRCRDAVAVPVAADDGREMIF